MQIKGRNRVRSFLLLVFIIFSPEKLIKNELKENKRTLAGKSHKTPGIFNKGMMENGVLPSTIIQVKKGLNNPTTDASLRVICNRLIKFFVENYSWFVIFKY